MSITEIFISILTNSYNFVSKWGYLGILVVSLVSSATIIFPVPIFLILFTFGAVLNPFFVALAGAIGATIGNLTSYFLGLGGKEVLEHKYDKELKKLKKTFDKHGAIMWIITVNVTPLPNDIVGIFCGVIRYDFKKYFLASFVGQMILALLLAYAGYYSINWILDFVSPRLGL